MDELTDLFAKIVLNNPNKTVIECYNFFIDKIEEKDLPAVTSHCQLFLKIGEASRNSDTEIQDIICEKSGIKYR